MICGCMLTVSDEHYTNYESERQVNLASPFFAFFPTNKYPFQKYLVSNNSFYEWIQRRLFTKYFLWFLRKFCSVFSVFRRHPHSARHIPGLVPGRRAPMSVVGCYDHCHSGRAVVRSFTVLSVHVLGLGGLVAEEWKVWSWKLLLKCAMYDSWNCLQLLYLDGFCGVTVMFGGEEYEWYLLKEFENQDLEMKICTRELKKLASYWTCDKKSHNEKFMSHFDLRHTRDKSLRSLPCITNHLLFKWFAHKSPARFKV